MLREVRIVRRRWNILCAIIARDLRLPQIVAWLAKVMCR